MRYQSRLGALLRKLKHTLDEWPGIRRIDGIIDRVLDHLVQSAKVHHFGSYDGAHLDSPFFAAAPAWQGIPRPPHASPAAVPSRSTPPQPSRRITFCCAEDLRSRRAGSHVKLLHGCADHLLRLGYRLRGLLSGNVTRSQSQAANITTGTTTKTLPHTGSVHLNWISEQFFFTA